MYKSIFKGIYNKMIQGRNGFDDLCKVQLYFLGILFIIDLFVDSYVVGLLQLITMIIIGYRFFSKNIYRRVKENQIFMDVKYGLFKPFKNIKRRIKDRKHLYKRCKCGTTIKVKLPKKRGIKHAKCPNCGKRNSILALRKRK